MILKKKKKKENCSPCTVYLNFPSSLPAGTYSRTNNNLSDTLEWCTLVSRELLKRRSALFHVARARVCDQSLELNLTNF